MPQPLDYHDFADKRAAFGIGNFLDVGSNLAFAIAGLAGLFITLNPRTCFVHAYERWPYGVFFVGVLLTAAGSAYYHVAPGNETFVWDRLPMTIGFMSLVSAQIVDRVSPSVGVACSRHCCWSDWRRWCTGLPASVPDTATSCPTECCKRIRS